MIKYTAGSWTDWEELDAETDEPIIDPAPTDDTAVESPFGVCVAETGALIGVAWMGTTFGQHISRDEARANAKLWAAAPELLAGIKRLCLAYVSLLETGRDRIVSAGGSCDPVDVMEASSPALRAARSIIARAEGR